MPWDDIRAAAVANNVPWKLLGAIAMAETGGDGYKCRYEPAYKYLFNVKEFSSDLGITLATEEMHQKTSWGLCQVMGANARENGFDDHLQKLSDPVLGLKYSCLYIKKLVSKYTTQDDIISAYNAGSVIKDTNGSYKNQYYVSKVAGFLKDLDL